jgi:site-specific DNA-methyltransferase (adenine-specific)
VKQIILGDSGSVLPTLPAGFARLVYIDPPFNTGKRQSRTGGAYEDSFDDFEGFLMPRIEASLRCMTPDASLFVHLDYREVHYIKVALDKLLGRDHFVNEIIWAYDYGGRPKTRWPAKHDTILWYCMDPKRYCFNYDEIDRIPYMAPGLVGPEKAERGKTPTDVWWHTIVPTNGREKTGYPTQKPLGVLNRLIRVHSSPGDTVLDFFCGSGTTGEAAARNNRGFVLIDRSIAAVEVASRRLREFKPEQIGWGYMIPWEQEIQ